jgi:hypothetical protein
MTTTMCLNEYYFTKSTEDVLPDDGPVCLKHVEKTPNVHIYCNNFNYILNI